jgi:pSer/pThr/pTyr-binding forkhead associated (FHA) protein
MGKYSNMAKDASSDTLKTSFLFIKGKYSGGEFFIKDGQKLAIGRDISSDIAIVDSKVSRHHATIISRAGRIFIEDKGSTNGTYIDEERIEASKPIEVFPGTVFSIGDSVIRIAGDKPENNDEMSEENGKTDSRSSKTAPEAKNVRKDKPLTLDVSLSASAQGNKDRISVAKVALKKGGPATTAQTVPDSTLAASKGSLSAIDPLDLLKYLSQSRNSGYLLVNITAPFSEKIEIALGVTGINAADAITSRNFAQEKVLSRFLLAKDGEYEFKIDDAPKNEKPNDYLEDVFMEISNQRGTLLRYRKMINADQLRFQIPITGKLSDLSKKELETLQFMVNTREVAAYLNIFPENDDFILLSEILKFVDLGILFGDNNEEENDPLMTVTDDILEI